MTAQLKRQSMTRIQLKDRKSALKKKVARYYTYLFLKIAQQLRCKDSSGLLPLCPNP